MVSERLVEHYRSYYGSAELSESRRIGAIDKVENIRELTRPVQIGSVLDIGCGDGAIISRLAELDFASRYFGVDISESAIDLAKERDIREAEFATFDGDALPFDDGSYDIAVLSHVVEHLEHPRVLLREARRVARRVIVEVPCEHTIRLSKDYTENSVGHINFYTPVTIRRLLQTCGLTVERQITRGCSLATMRFDRPWFGVFQHVVREMAMKVAPGVAPAIFVYHTALICQ